MITGRGQRIYCSYVLFHCTVKSTQPAEATACATFLLSKEFLLGETAGFLRPPRGLHPGGEFGGRELGGRDPGEDGEAELGEDGEGEVRVALQLRHRHRLPQQSQHEEKLGRLEPLLQS